MSKLQVTSPHGQITVTFGLTDPGVERGVPAYRIEYKGQPMLKESRLGLKLENGVDLLGGFELESSSSHTHDETWKPLYGEREFERDRYNALSVVLKDKQGRVIQVEFRVYNEGAAFRYVLPMQPNLGPDIVITEERSQFHFPHGCLAYEHHGAEGEYHLVAVADLKKDCERPLTVKYPGDTYVALTEAGLVDFPRMLLAPCEEWPGSIVTQLSGLITAYVGYDNMDTSLEGEKADELVRASLPLATPWRVLVVGDTPGELLEHNGIIMNLSAPCEIADMGWIVSGKVLRDMTITNEGGKACVDFAAAHGLQYVMLDWGWYGDPFDDRSVCTNEVNDIWYLRMEEGVEYPKLHIRELIGYAEAKGVGIILYLDRRAVEKQLDSLLPVYKEWGVKGIKIGFANTGPQYWTRWLHEVVRRCAEYGILVNVHDAYRPTGYSRTYPNLLTQEGIRGNEHMPTARHNCTLPFTRFIAGAGDYTICYYTDRKQTTFAHQLGMAVVAYSPLQSVLWYDKPSHYEGEPEIEFFKHLPTVWDDTRVMHGSIGEFAVIARRSGEEWFVGCITNEQGRELRIKLNFLEEGRPYLAYIYSDAHHDQQARTKVAVAIREVTAATELHALMAPCGGQAIRLAPKAVVRESIR